MTKAKKISIVSVATLLILVFGILPRVFSGVTHRRLERLVTKVNATPIMQNNGYQFTLTNYKINWFHSTADLAIKPVKGSAKPKTLLKMDIYSGPIVFHNGVHFESAFIESNIPLPSELTHAIPASLPKQLKFYMQSPYFGGYNMTLHTNTISLTHNFNGPATPNMKIGDLSLSLSIPSLKNKKFMDVVKESKAAYELDNIQVIDQQHPKQNNMTLKNFKIAVNLKDSSAEVGLNGLSFNHSEPGTSPKQVNKIQISLGKAGIYQLHVDINKIIELLHNKQALTGYLIALVNQYQRSMSSIGQAHGANDQHQVSKLIEFALNKLAQNLIDNKTNLRFDNLNISTTQSGVKKNIAKGSFDVSWPQLPQNHDLADLFQNMKYNGDLSISNINNGLFKMSGFNLNFNGTPSAKGLFSMKLNNLKVGNPSKGEFSISGISYNSKSSTNLDTPHPKINGTTNSSGQLSVSKICLQEPNKGPRDCFSVKGTLKDNGANFTKNSIHKALDGSINAITELVTLVNSHTKRDGINGYNRYQMDIQKAMKNLYSDKFSGKMELTAENSDHKALTIRIDTSRSKNEFDAVNVKGNVSINKDFLSKFPLQNGAMNTVLDIMKTNHCANQQGNNYQISFTLKNEKNNMGLITPQIMINNQSAKSCFVPHIVKMRMPQSKDKAA
jgi:hypothetical protein